MSGPLDGVRVGELATVLMAPFAGQLLGDLGADVVKVESDRHDAGRIIGGGGHHQISGAAVNLQRNKRSIQVDLKQPAGRDVLFRLVAGADVLITNMRPAALERLGLDHGAFADQPQLIYCEAHGFRTGTADAERPAFDDIIQAETGLPRLHERIGSPTAFMPALMADKVSGLYIVQAVLAALVHQRTTGRGQRVELPMFDAVLSFNLVEHLARAAFPGGEAGYSRILSAHRGPHKTLDGYVAALPYSDRDWEALYEAVGRADELDTPVFRDPRLRLEHPDVVYGSLASVIAERTTAEWIELCLAIGVPVAPVPTLDEIVADEARHRGVVRDAEHPVVGPYREIAPPIIFDDTPMSVRRPAPLVGQHTVELLDEVGFTADEIAALLATNTVHRAQEVPDVQL
jgi:crotonobetainyl-CoA:carnitine CoA-transferase CaiB-like acyl-CoA transferase